MPRSKAPNDNCGSRAAKPVHDHLGGNAPQADLHSSRSDSSGAHQPLADTIPLEIPIKTLNEKMRHVSFSIEPGSQDDGQSRIYIDREGGHLPTADESSMEEPAAALWDSHKGCGVTALSKKGESQESGIGADDFQPAILVLEIEDPSSVLDAKV